MKLPSFGRVSKVVYALAAAVGVMASAGLITQNVAVWISTASTAVVVGLATYAAPKNQS